MMVSISWFGRVYCLTKEESSLKLEFRVTGVVRVQETKRPLAGLIIRAYDKDLLYDDLLGNATTDALGRFEIHYSGSDFRELFEQHPDIYFIILDSSGKHVVHSTAESVRWNAGADEFFEIDIPAYKCPPSEEKEIELVDSQGNKQSDFEVGESLLISTQGLSPDRSHLIRLLDEAGNEILSASFLTDRHGVIEPTVLWPDIAIGDPKSISNFSFETYEKALTAMAGRTFIIEFSDGRTEKEGEVQNHRENVKSSFISEFNIRHFTKRIIARTR